MKTHISRHRFAQLCSLVCVLLIFWITHTVYQRFESEALSGLTLRTVTEVSSGKQVELPTQWVGKPGDLQRKQFEISFYYTELDNRAQYLYIPRYEQGLSVRLNGVNIHSPSINRNWAGPLNFNSAMIAIPDNVLLVEKNTLTLTLLTGPLPAGSLSSIYIGHWDAISDVYSFRQFFETELKWLNYGLFLMLFMISLIYSTTIARSRIYTTLAIAIASLLLVRIGILAQPFPDVVYLVPYFFLLTPIGGMAYLAFSLELLGKNGSRALLTGFLVTVVAFLLVWLSNLGIREIALLVAAPALILGVMGASACIIFHSLKKPHAETTLLFSGSVIYVLAVSHDVLGRLGIVDATIMLSHVSSSIIALGLITFLMRRQATISASLTESKNLLAAKLEQREKELKQAFDEKELLAKRAATEAERHRITSELHDGVAGDLVAIIALSELNSDEPKSIRDMAKMALAELRMIIDTFSSDDSGLPMALAAFRERCSKTLTPLGIEFDWVMNKLPDDTGLSPADVLNILRILQEAVANAIKHGNPQHLSVIFSSSGRRVTITVINSGGQAFQKVGHGYGISNMNERASKLPEAELSITETSDGTQLRLVFSLPEH